MLKPSVFKGHGKLAFLLLGSYLWILLSMQAIAFNVEMKPLFFALPAALGFFFSYLALRYLPEPLDRIRLCAENRHCRLFGVLIAIVTMLFLLVYFLGYYPGGMSYDSRVQYMQAVGETPYSDWHPVLHTLLFFTLPLRIAQRFDLIILLQLLYFSLAFGYAMYAVYKNHCPRPIALCICIYVWLNPFLFCNMMYPWKDNAMTIFATLLMGYYVQIICTRGVWLEKKLNLAVFCIAAVLCSFMRHNAVLFVAPLVLLVLFYSIRKARLRIGVVAGIALLFSLVKISYTGMGIEQPGNRIVETVGLPATIWCNVMKCNPEALPEETRAFMYELATQESYENDYTTGAFNSIKFKSQINTAKINSLTYAQVLRYTYQCFRYAPNASIDALVKLTRVVWGIDGETAPTSVYIASNKWNIQSKIFPFFDTLVGQMNQFFSCGLGRFLFGSIGLHLLVLLAAGLCLLARGRLSLLHMLPLFFYNFGTMLLLSGEDYRFFIYCIPLWPIALFMMIRDDRKIAPSIEKTDGKGVLKA